MRAVFGQLFFSFVRGVKLKKKSENLIERSICDFLTYQGWDVVKIPAAGFFFKDDRGARFRKHASPYVRNGLPDLLALRQGRRLWLEVKSEIGRQSPSQKEMQLLLEKNGEEYNLVRSIEDVQKLI